MKANELRRKFIDWFVKNYNHKEIPGASLIPENDPTVLFTTAGMHPLVPFLLGEKHPAGTRLVDVQRCIRTGDIDSVGDRTHLTFFEMLGNWSLGDYFKNEAIEMSFLFLTSPQSEGGLGIPMERLSVSCFAGDNDAPRDEEAASIWESHGFKKHVDGEALSGGEIYFYSKKENWWGPAGQTGPCGPDTEIYYITEKEKCPNCDKNGISCDCHKCVEIWNNVFMQYNKNEDGSFVELAQKNVDTGMGLERTLFILNGFHSNYDSELFLPITSELRLLGGYELSEENIRNERICADHLRTSTFILGDELGIPPSNTDQGYILRRLIRRAICAGMKLGIENDFCRKIAGIVVKEYGTVYPTLLDKQEFIFAEMAGEEEKFRRTLVKGLDVLKKAILKNAGKEGGKVSEVFGVDFVFDMFQTFGFPVEMTIEELKNAGYAESEAEVEALKADFERDFCKHQELSRAGAEQKFAGGLADHSEVVTRYHTATHLLHKALRMVLGDHVQQRGSNLTAERLRFDFSHPSPMTPEQIAEVEKIVNDQIEKALPVSCMEMSVDEAKSLGAIGLFENKYGNSVKVYKVGDDDNWFSMEICGGP
ncbi:MAG: alanine--tRNA ligase, partial [Candidatus Gracilibacteria bacterium]|nr:alanine--tRNA ligase [Candidatus Gracilibacteria bacterium]